MSRYRPSIWDLRPRVPLRDFAIGLIGLVILLFVADAPLLGMMKRMPDWFTGFFQWLTHFADSGYLLVNSAIIGLIAYIISMRAFWRTSRAMARFVAEASLFFFTSIAMSGILINLIKLAVGRTRPKAMMNDALFSFDPPGTSYVLQSFPSGHANTAIAMTFALGLLVPRFRAPLLMLGCLIGYSRVAIGAHYLSDIFAGGLIAIFTTLWLARIFARHELVFQPRPGAPFGLTHTPGGRLLLKSVKLS